MSVVNCLHVVEPDTVMSYHVPITGIAPHVRLENQYVLS